MSLIHVALSCVNKQMPLKQWCRQIRNKTFSELNELAAGFRPRLENKSLGNCSGSRKDPQMTSAEIQDWKKELLGHNHKRYLWSGANKACDERCSVPGVKHGGASLRFWGVWAPKGDWVQMDARWVQHVSRKYPSNACSLQPGSCGWDWIFQHNDPTLTCCRLQQSKVKVLEWPSVSWPHHSGEISKPAAQEFTGSGGPFPGRRGGCTTGEKRDLIHAERPQTVRDVKGAKTRY